MELEKVIEGIMLYREKIHKENLWQNPTALSDIMVKLGVYLSYLGDWIPVLHKEATDTAYQIFVSEKAHGVGKAEQAAKGGSTEERYNYENAKQLYSSIDNLLSLLQSRLRVIESQLKNKI